MLKHSDYCVAHQPGGSRVFGWIVCGRGGVPTHLNLEARDGGKSGVLVALDGLTDVHPYPVATTPLNLPA
jgi:hypothetical protein